MNVIEGRGPPTHVSRDFPGSISLHAALWKRSVSLGVNSDSLHDVRSERDCVAASAYKR